MTAARVGGETAAATELFSTADSIGAEEKRYITPQTRTEQKNRTGHLPNQAEVNKASIWERRLGAGGGVLGVGKGRCCYRLVLKIGRAHV